MHLGLREAGLLGHLLSDERVRVVRLLKDVFQELELLRGEHGPVPPHRRLRPRRLRLLLA